MEGLFPVLGINGVAYLAVTACIAIGPRTEEIWHTGCVGFFILLEAPGKRFPPEKKERMIHYVQSGPPYQFAILSIHAASPLRALADWLSSHRQRAHFHFQLVVRPTEWRNHDPTDR